MEGMDDRVGPSRFRILGDDVADDDQVDQDSLHEIQGEVSLLIHFKPMFYMFDEDLDNLPFYFILPSMI